MISAVVLLPDTALLVPGAAGRSDPLVGLRAAALDALVGGPVPDLVRVIAPGRRDRDLVGARASLAAAGVPSTLVPEVGAVGAPVADVPASVALLLLDAAARDAVDGDAVDGDEEDGTVRPAGAGSDAAGTLVVTEVARGSTGTAALRDRGSRAAGLGPRPGPGGATGTDPRELLVVVGSLSARHGEDAPLAADPRAPETDSALVTALGEGPDALARVLDALDPALAVDALAISGWGPWQVLLGMLAARGRAEVASCRVLAVTTGSALGSHAVARWDLAPAVPSVRSTGEESR
ncbi:MAG TPA: hypothetical protein VGC57_06150 [Cellulomonas sp.]